MTFKEKLEKEIQMKNLLNIPFDSLELIDSLMPNVIELELKGNLEIDYNYGTRSGMIYLFKNDQLLENSNSKLASITNKLQKIFYIPDDREHCTLDLVVNGHEYHFDRPSDTFFNTSMIGLLHGDMKLFTKLGKVPTTLDLKMRFTRKPVKKAREQHFHSSRGRKTCEEKLNEIFGTKIQESRINHVRNASRYGWSSPFDRDSLKGKIYSLNKEHAAFFIEYLWGKKLKMSASNSELCRFLASAQNKRFGINDIQVAKQLTDYIRETDYNVLKSRLLQVGIKPATDMRRWVKIRGLQFEDLTNK